MAELIDRDIEAALAAGWISNGADNKFLTSRFDGATLAAVGHTKKSGSAHNIPWTAEDEETLRNSLGLIPVQELAQALGRTADALKIRQYRKGMKPATKRFLSARDVGRILGCDSKKVARLIHEGRFPGFELATVNVRYAIRLYKLKRWLIRPENWPLFNVEHMGDPSLKRLVKLAQERWGDEWWTTVQAAEYLDCDTRDITRHITSGKLPGYQPWLPGSGWYLKRSEVVRHRIPKGRGAGHELDCWNDAGDIHLLICEAVGLPRSAVAGMNDGYGGDRHHRLYWLLRTGRASELIEEYGLSIRFDVERRLLFADWRDHLGRLPGVLRSVNRFIAGKRLNKQGRYVVQGILRSWASWYGADAQLVKRLTVVWTGRTSRLRELYNQLRTDGVDPFGMEVNDELV